MMETTIIEEESNRKPEKSNRSYLTSISISDIVSLKTRCDSFIEFIQAVRDGCWELGIIKGDNYHKDITEDIAKLLMDFKHLYLRTDFSLHFYSEKSFHGPTGFVAAELNQQNKFKPILRVVSSKFQMSRLSYYGIQNTAIDPLEAIGGDGSIESFVEAIILRNMLRVLPFRPAQHQFQFIDQYPFSSGVKEWEIYTELRNWNPCGILKEDNCEIRICTIDNQTHVLHSLETSDYVYLNVYSFFKDSLLFGLDNEKNDYPLSINASSWPCYSHCSEKKLLLGKEVKEFKNIRANIK